MRTDLRYVRVSSQEPMSMSPALGHYFTHAELFPTFQVVISNRYSKSSFPMATKIRLSRFVGRRIHMEVNVSAMSSSPCPVIVIVLAIVKKKEHDHWIRLESENSRPRQYFLVVFSAYCCRWWTCTMMRSILLYATTGGEFIEKLIGVF